MTQTEVPAEVFHDKLVHQLLTYVEKLETEKGKLARPETPKFFYCPVCLEPLTHQFCTTHPEVERIDAEHAIHLLAKQISEGRHLLREMGAQLTPEGGSEMAKAKTPKRQEGEILIVFSDEEVILADAKTARKFLRNHSLSVRQAVKDENDSTVWHLEEVEAPAEEEEAPEAE